MPQPKDKKKARPLVQAKKRPVPGRAGQGVAKKQQGAGKKKGVVEKPPMVPRRGFKRLPDKGKIKPLLPQDKLQELLDKAQSRGFVTYSEILYQFPGIEIKVDALEELYSSLEKAGLRVEEVQEYLTTIKKEDADKARLEQESPLDPVQMYLKEIGKIPFVTAEQERDLAKRIEEGDMEAKKQLARANLRLVVSIAKKSVGRSPNLTLLDRSEERRVGK